MNVNFYKRLGRKIMFKKDNSLLQPRSLSLLLTFIALMPLAAFRDDTTCEQPLIIFTEFEQNSNSIKCISNDEPITLISEEDIVAAYLSPNSDYIAYVIQNGEYLSEQSSVQVYSFDTQQSVTVRSGDGLIVPYWNSVNRLILQSYATFPRPLSEVFYPDFTFQYDPVTQQLLSLDIPPAIYRGYFEATNQYILSDYSYGAFYFGINGELVDIELPDEIPDPLGISVSNDGGLIVYRYCNNRNLITCFMVYDLETAIGYSVVPNIPNPEYGISNFQISSTERFVAASIGQGGIAVYDLRNQQMVYVSEDAQTVSGGYAWHNDNDTLIISYLAEPGNANSGSNLFALELPAGNLEQLTNTGSWKTIR